MNHINGSGNFMSKRLKGKEQTDTHKEEETAHTENMIENNKISKSNQKFVK